MTKIKMNETMVKVQTAVTRPNLSKEVTTIEDRAAVAAGNLVFNARKALKEAEATKRAVVVTNNMLDIYDGDISAEMYNQVLNFVTDILSNGREITDIDGKWNVLCSWNKKFMVNVKINRIFVLIAGEAVVNIASV